MKIRQLGPELFMRTEGQTDMAKLIVAFHNFANPPKNGMGRLADEIEQEIVTEVVRSVREVQ
jgi:hypothetical protein